MYPNADKVRLSQREKGFVKKPIKKISKKNISIS